MRAKQIEPCCPPPPPSPSCRPVNTTQSTPYQACCRSPTPTMKQHAHCLHHPSPKRTPHQHHCPPTSSPFTCTSTTPKNPWHVHCCHCSLHRHPEKRQPDKPPQQHHPNNATACLPPISHTFRRMGFAPPTTTPQKQCSTSAAVALTAPTMPPRERSNNKKDNLINLSDNNYNLSDPILPWLINEKENWKE